MLSPPLEDVSRGVSESGVDAVARGALSRLTAHHGEESAAPAEPGPSRRTLPPWGLPAAALAGATTLTAIAAAALLMMMSPPDDRDEETIVASPHTDSLEASPTTPPPSRHALARVESLRDQAEAALASGAPARAADLLDEAMTLGRTHPEYPEIVRERLDLYLEAGELEQAADLLLDAERRMRADGSWTLHQPDPTAGVQLLEKMLRTTALAVHRAGRASEDDAAPRGEAAAALYEAWFTRFPGHEREAAMSYAYAELSYERGRYATALTHYERVFNEHPDSEHARFCGESAVFAYSKLMADPASAELWYPRFAAHADRLLERDPDHAEASQLAYKVAYHAYHLGRDDARTRLSAIIERHPTSTEADHAKDLLLDLLVKEEDWAALADQAEAFARDPDTPEAQRADLEDIAAKADWQRLVEEEPDEQAIRAWEERWERERPDSE